MANDVQISALALIRRMQDRMDKIAHKCAEGGLELHAYWVEVGKYRQCRSLKQSAEETIEKADRAQPRQESEREFGDLDLDEGEVEEMASTRPARRRLGGKAHAWGGS